VRGAKNEEKGAIQGAKRPRRSQKSTRSLRQERGGRGKMQNSRSHAGLTETSKKPGGGKEEGSLRNLERPQGGETRRGQGGGIEVFRGKSRLSE